VGKTFEATTQLRTSSSREGKHTRPGASISLRVNSYRGLIQVNSGRVGGCW